MRDTRPDYPPEFDEWTEEEAREDIAELRAELAEAKAAKELAEAQRDRLIKAVYALERSSYLCRHDLSLDQYADGFVVSYHELCKLVTTTGGTNG